MNPKPENEIDMIRGRMLVGHATAEELQDFLTYTSALEGLLQLADLEDFLGTEGYRRELKHSAFNLMEWMPPLDGIAMCHVGLGQQQKGGIHVRG